MLLNRYRHTGIDAVLDTNECNIDQSSVQDTKVKLTTAGDMF